MFNVERNFNTRELSESQKKMSDDLRAMYIELGRKIDHSMIDSREKSLALTKLEEALMWTTKAISLNGVVQYHD